MALNWSKHTRRGQTRTAKRMDVDIARILSDDRPAPPSKEQLRADMADAMARYRGTIRQLPTIVELKCYKCNHRGKAIMPNGNTTKRFKCSKCGAMSL